MIRWAAWGNVAVHVAGLVVAALFIRPGVPGVADVERLSFLAGRPIGWSIGWAVWIVCALALVGFTALVSDDRPSRRAALAFAAAGAAIDCLCDVVYIVVVPTLAEQGGPTFYAVERTAQLGGQVVANGFYSLAVLLLSLGRSDRPRYLGYATFTAGMGMVAASFIREPRLLELVTGAAIGLYCLWTLSVADEKPGPQPVRP